MTEDGDLLDDCARAVLTRHDPNSWRHHIDDVWHFVTPIGGQLPKQGWKLHVPATPLSACVVLSRCVRVLAEHRCAFKFAKSMHQLQVLIEPNAARSAAGKFLTAYPRDDEQAVRIAAVLHEATLGLPGQVILSDRRFRPNSQVFYRYGGFTPDRVLTDDGDFVPVLVDGTGTPIPDRREIGRAVPTWLSDPFQPQEIAPPTPPRSVLIDDRYQVTSAIRQTNRGGVYVATDTQTNAQVILKRFRVHTAAALNQTDSRNRARAEARMLAALGPKGVSPRFLDLLTHDGDMFVVQEKLDGVPLRRYVARNLHPIGDGALSIDTTVALDLAAQLVDLLAEVHAIGYVLGDLSPNNVMVLPGNRLKLIDLESALRDWEVAIRLTTKSYTPPEDLSRPRLIAPAPPVTSDLYSLGATLFYLASGAHPPAASTVDHVDRIDHIDDVDDIDNTINIVNMLIDIVDRMAIRNPTVAALRPVLTGLLATNPADRPSLTTVRAMLRDSASPEPAVPARLATAVPAPVVPARLVPVEAGSAAAAVPAPPEPAVPARHATAAPARPTPVVAAPPATAVPAPVMADPPASMEPARLAPVEASHEAAMPAPPGPAVDESVVAAPLAPVAPSQLAPVAAASLGTAVPARPAPVVAGACGG